MHRTTRLVALASLLFIACHGDGSDSPNGDDSTSSTTSAVLKPPLTVPTNTIITATPGVLAPKGDGTLGVDDRGQAHQHIPVWVPPGRAGIQPELSVEYTSGGGNGPIGAGWGIGGLSQITRCQGLRKNGAISQPVEWNIGDSLCLDGEPLWTDSDRTWYYKFHSDGSRIQAYSENGKTYYKLFQKSGRIVTYGRTADSMVTATRFVNTPQTMTWAISRVEDRAGNFMTYTYDLSSGGDLRIKRIDYTGSPTDATKRSVTFTYETRPDVDYRMFGQQIFTYPDRLHSIEMHAPNSANLDPLRTVTFGYSTSTVTGRSLLSNLAECDGWAPPTLPVVGSQPLCRQQSFTYAPGVAAGASNAFTSTNLDSNGQLIQDVSMYAMGGVQPTVRLLDVDGDGRDDVLYMSNDPSATYHLRLWDSTHSTFGPAIATGIAAAIPVNQVSGATTAPVVLDFNMDGHADIVVNEGPGQSYLCLAHKGSSGWTIGGPGYTYQLQSGFSNYQAADLDGDGRPDLVELLNGNAYYATNLDGTFAHLTNPVELDGQANTNYKDAPNSFFIDFNNDGVTDVMTRRWASTTCKPHLVDQTCKCTMIGFGVVDIGNWLYPTYSNPGPTDTTTVNGISYCTGDYPDDVTYGHLFGDFNGDGYVDTIETLVPPLNDDGTQPPMQLKMMLGGGTQSFNTTTPGGSLTLNPASSFQTMDVDGDGKTDLLVRSGIGTQPYTVYSWKNQAWQPGTPLMLTEPEASLGPQRDAFTTGDINGDGQTDIVALDAAGNLDIYTRVVGSTGAAPADLLTNTAGDFTPNTNVGYAPHRIASNESRSDCVWPLTCVTRTGYLVSSVATDNGIGGMNTQTHSYDGARADLLGWGFLGFKSHSFTDQATGAVTTRTFDFTRNTSGATPFYPYVGMPTEVDTTILYKTGATSVTRKTLVTNTYGVQGTGPFITTPNSTRTEVNDSNFPDVDLRLTSRGFDELGNQTFERTQYFPSAEEIDTTTTYANDTTDNYLVGRPTYVSTTSMTNITFNGSTSSTHDTAYTYDALGNLVVTIDNPGATNGSSYDPLPQQDDGVQTLYTRITRDPHGLPHIIEKLDNLSAPTVDRQSQLDYDASEGMFVVQTTDPANLVTQAAYDAGLGVVAASTDAAGVLTTFQYDTFGRIRADHPAAGGGRIVAYNAATSGNHGIIDDHRSGEYDTKTYLDSLRRTIKTVTSGRADGKSVYVETTYDKFGNTKTVSRPHFSGVTPAKTTYTYDNVGRVTLIQGADSSTVSTSYLGRTVTTTNADGNMSAVTSDSLGRPLTSTQAKTTGPSGLSGPVTTTTLAYGPFNTLVSSTDTLGNVVTSVYDRTGRLRWKRDRDSSATAYRYDVLGEITDEFRGTTPIPVFFNGHTTWVFNGGTDTQFAYDADGRVTTETTDDGEQIVHTYDTVMPGKLSSETITNGPTIAYTYYATTGQLHTKNWTGPRGPIGYSYNYDGYGRLWSMGYPALPGNKRSMLLSYTYSGADIGGQLTKIDDVSTTATTNVWKLVSTDASEAFPVEQLFYNVQTTRTEDPFHPGWLYTIGATDGTTTVQSLRYTREGGGRVKKREDLVPTTPTVETFGYDGLERLTSWTWNGAAGARGANYVYDDIGNLLQRTITAGPGTSVTYTPGASGSSGPFGPHQNASDSLGTTYQYDTLGEQLSAPGRTFTWNELGRPASVTTAAGAYQMTYDPELARFSRTDPAGHTRYSYGGLFDEFTDATGTHDVLTVMAAGRPVGELEITNYITLDAPRSALLTDALGSVDAIDLGGGVQSVKYDPFGTRVSATDPTVRTTTPPSDLRAGFTGHDHDDDVNLIDMIGRVYDPQQQRFLSVDPPAPDPVDGQGYNPYAYVRNNPLNATDPTGYYEVTLGGAYLGNDGQDAYGVWSSATPKIGHQNVVSIFGIKILVIWATQWTGNTQGADATAGPKPATALATMVPEPIGPTFANLGWSGGGGGGEGAGGGGGGDAYGFQLGDGSLEQQFADHYAALLDELAKPSLPHHVDERPGQISDASFSDLTLLLALAPVARLVMAGIQRAAVSSSMKVVEQFVREGEALSNGNATIWGRMYTNGAGERRLLGAVTGGNGEDGALLLRGADIAEKLEAGLAGQGVNADVVAAAQQNVLVHAERLGFRIETTLRAQGWTPVGNALTNRAACLCFGPGCSFAQTMTQTLVLPK